MCGVCMCVFGSTPVCEKKKKDELGIKEEERRGTGAEETGEEEER